MNKPIVPLTYEQLDRWIKSLQPALAAENFAAVIGILRGGAPLALMVSHTVSAPVAFLRYDRITREVRWDSTLPMPEPGSTVLLCTDIAGHGFTLIDCITFLREYGLTVRTMTGAYDDLSRLRPDYSIDASSYFALFPEERHAYTEHYRADWVREDAHENTLLSDDQDYDAVYAIDLDGILLPDTAQTAAQDDDDLEPAFGNRDALLPFWKIPNIDLQHARAVITSRPETDRARTQSWLERLGFSHLELIMRTPGEYDETPAGAAAYKANAALHCNATHFIESDPVQAILIAQRTPQLRVIWWNAHTRTSTLIGASAWG